MFQLYEPNFVNTPIETQYGTIEYLDWLTREKARIEQDPKRKAEIAFVGETQVRLLVNEAEGCECEACQRVFPKRRGQ